MRVFVTGASGHIGSAVVPELIEAGHEVVGLARSEASAEALTAVGAKVQRGDLDDLEGLAEASADADGVIHLAFKHELGDLVRAAEFDLRAVQAMRAALEGSDKPFVSTSGTLLLARAGTGSAGNGGRARSRADPRVDSENTVIASSQRGVRSSVVRLAPLVHSTLDHHGSRPCSSRRPGTRVWRRTSATAPTAGPPCTLSMPRACTGWRSNQLLLVRACTEWVTRVSPSRAIAEVIGRHLGVPVDSVAPEDADEHFGFLGPLVGLDNPTSNERTRELLGWRPTHAGLLEDLDEGHYFVL